MAKLFRLHVATLYVYFQCGVDVLGFPNIHTHTRIISKSINEVDAKKYGLL